MKILKKIDWSFKSIAKWVGVGLLGIVVLAVVVALIGFSVRTFRGTFQIASVERAFDMGMAPQGFVTSSKAFIPPIPGPDFSGGADAENFEIRTYNGDIKTRQFEKTCAVFEGLKSREEVIFESSDKNEDNCYFRFKVKKENEQEIVEVIKNLKPDNFNVNIQTIKGTLETYDKELAILEKQLNSIDDTLSKAQEAYDEIGELATRKQDVESLALIIDNKLKLIDKLTNDRLQIKERIDRYNQSKADQLERLNYSFFNISVIKDVILDLKDVKDSWKEELKMVAANINKVIQGISVGLLLYLFYAVQAVVYLLLSVFLLKWLWFAVKFVWRGKKK